METIEAFLLGAIMGAGSSEVASEKREREFEDWFECADGRARDSFLVLRIVLCFEGSEKGEELSDSELAEERVSEVASVEGS